MLSSIKVHWKSVSLGADYVKQHRYARIQRATVAGRAAQETVQTANSLSRNFTMPCERHTGASPVALRKREKTIT